VSEDTAIEDAPLQPTETPTSPSEDNEIPETQIDVNPPASTEDDVFETFTHVNAVPESSPASTVVPITYPPTSPTLTSSEVRRVFSKTPGFPLLDDGSHGRLQDELTEALDNHRLATRCAEQDIEHLRPDDNRPVLPGEAVIRQDGQDLEEEIPPEEQPLDQEMEMDEEMEEQAWQKEDIALEGIEQEIQPDGQHEEDPSLAQDKMETDEVEKENGPPIEEGETEMDTSSSEELTHRPPKRPVRRALLLESSEDDMSVREEHGQPGDPPSSPLSSVSGQSRPDSPVHPSSRPQSSAQSHGRHNGDKTFYIQVPVRRTRKKKADPPKSPPSPNPDRHHPNRGTQGPEDHDEDQPIVETLRPKSSKLKKVVDKRRNDNTTDRQEKAVLPGSLVAEVSRRPSFLSSPPTPVSKPCALRSSISESGTDVESSCSHHHVFSRPRRSI
jgi:hypothetical protein